MHIVNEEDKKDYDYIEKLKSKTERELKRMLDTSEKEITKIKAEQIRINNRLNDKIKKQHFIKDALMEKWRTPSDELLEAIKEIENGEGIVCDSMEEFSRTINAD